MKDHTCARIVASVSDNWRVFTNIQEHTREKSLISVSSATSVSVKMLIFSFMKEHTVEQGHINVNFVGGVSVFQETVVAMKDPIWGTSHIVANCVTSVLAKQVIFVAIKKYIVLQGRGLLNASSVASVLQNHTVLRGMRNYMKKRSYMNVVCVGNVSLAHGNCKDMK